MGGCRLGERFPNLEVRTLDGGTLRLPDGLLGGTVVLLFYRGHF